MVRASHQSSEGCGFEPRLGLRNRFLRFELDKRSFIIKDTSKLPHFQNIYPNSMFVQSIFTLPKFQPRRLPLMSKINCMALARMKLKSQIRAEES